MRQSSNTTLPAAFNGLSDGKKSHAVEAKHGSSTWLTFYN